MECCGSHSLGFRLLRLSVSSTNSNFVGSAVLSDSTLGVVANVSPTEHLGAMQIIPLPVLNSALPESLLTAGAVENVPYAISLQLLRSNLSMVAEADVRITFLACNTGA